ncbi:MULTISPECIES: Hsp20 family protein [Staphylococcus]|jgi:HSP20 family protein|uniref:Heat-shock protein n=1 Tax=Staphylococcus shinii TaxID=2912228 RepID=A0A418IC85_9STAP|nr:Hsp20 family protein [Staphylococcus shinii]MDW8565765.1 Hsp20 family protein [Staphylococcus shinii]MDW8566273.1 Hsp20 family protein [Staphylococcus shinii]MDW8569193.1 Hsp20 family protein [Staphylococcus shinii]MDW8572223.1 Hsp20 family protein [Staphylococcus shinii]MEC5300871.1 Hsp20 family protein [Staphylococcus shinii]
MIQSTNNLTKDLLESLVSDHHDFKVTVYQTQDSYTVEAELPGYQKDDITINFEHKTLTILAKRVSNIQQDSTYLINERNSNEQSRQFIFKNIDTNKINASMNNGILTVKLPIKQTKTQISID